MRVILYTGNGGVGKTSVAAATALQAAELGYRTVVALVVMLLLILSISCKTPTPELTPQPSPQSTPTTTWAPDGIITTGEYAKVKTYGDYEIHWFSDEQYIYIGLKAKTSGWVAVGIQPEPKLEKKNADLVLGFVKDGQTIVYDLFSTDRHGPHHPDTDLGGTNDILEFGGKEDNGYTTIEFKRALNTGDPYDHQLYEGENEIIWAYGLEDDPSSEHAKKGYGEIDL